MPMINVNMHLFSIEINCISYLVVWRKPSSAVLAVEPSRSRG